MKSQDWYENCLSTSPRAPAKSESAKPRIPALSTTTAPSVYSRANPYKARLIENYSLSGPGSNKDTRHLVVHLGDSGITYLPGDSLGVVPRNFPQNVDDLLPHLGIAPETHGRAADRRRSRARPAHPRLYPQPRQQEIRQGRAGKAARGPKKTALAEIVGHEETFDVYVFTRDYTDVLIEYPVQFTAAEFLPLANKITPRLYSIASSPKAHPGKVHLTVAVVKYHTHGRDKYGIASGYLAHGQELQQGRDPGLHSADETFPHAAAGRSR